MELLLALRRNITVIEFRPDTFNKGGTRMMDDIEKLSLEDLIKLDKRVVQRIQYLQGLRTQPELDTFQVGDRVSFQGESYGRKVEGIVTRINRKTLTVHTTDGQHWSIHPRFLTRLPTTLAPFPGILQGKLEMP